jgi:ubiquinone/menaquinone biosynthesis C-methylase UbiE
VLTKRCKLADRVALRVGNALELPYSEQTFDVIWCQNVAMNIADKAGLFAGVYRVLKPGGPSEFLPVRSALYINPQAAAMRAEDYWMITAERPKL